MTRGPLDPRLLRHARASRTGIAGLAVLGAGQAAATVVVAVALARIVTGHDALALLAAAFVLRAALTWAEQVVARRTAAAVTDDLRRSALAAALRHGPAWVARLGGNRLTAVLGSGLDSLRPWFSGYLPALVLGVALPPLVIVAMAVTDLTSALIALVTLPLIPVLGALIGWATRERAQRAWEADARLAGHFLDVVRGLTTLRVYGRADRQTTVVRDMTDRHRKATLRVLRVAFLSSTALDLVATLSVGLIAVEAGLRVAAGNLTLGPALLVILLAPEVYRPLREMAARYHASADASAVIADADEILTPSDDDPAFLPTGAILAGARDGRFGAGGGRPAVYASRLRVRHPGATVDALDLGTLAVRDGELVALRGPSGAGKTTALRVLAGLQPAVTGRVELSGPGLLYLPQRPALPHVRTVADVFPGSDPAAVREALHTVGLDTEIDPATVLGEHGSGVSAGQRQRLALAALLRAAGRAPAVLLLDEPTAHLDADAERLVIERLRAAADRGCAVLVVAHRPGLLAAADRIIDVTPPAPDAPPASGSAGDEDSRLEDELVAAGPVGGATVAAGPVGGATVAVSAPRATGAAGGMPSGPTATTLTDRAPTAAGPTFRPTASGPTLTPTSNGFTLTSTSTSTSTEPGRGAAAGGSRVARVAGWFVRRPGTAVGFGAASWLAGIVLTGAATWLLVRAATLPPVLTLSTAVVLVRGSAVARPLLRYVERLVSHDVAFARLGEWRARVFADLVPRVPGPRLRRRGDLLTRVGEDVDARVDGLLRGRLPALAAALTLALVALAAVAVLPAVAVPLAVGLLISGVAAPALAARQASRLDAATGRARAELRDAVVETVEGVEELAVRDRGDALAVPDRRSRELARLEARAARSAGAAAALGLLGWGVAVTGTALVAAGSALSDEWAAVLLLAVVALGEPIAALPDAAVARRRAAGARTRLAEIAAQPPSAGSHPAGPAGDIAVRGLVAGWDPGRPAALSGVDLDLPAGSRIAVLGPSGGGKSTLAAVLARLLDPRAGTVTGVGRSALVGDEADHVFASTVRENLRLARPGATDAQLHAALARVRLDGWLAGLPHGLDTWLGTGGGTISGGQRRRLATARALLADPDLLILDEPTEGLDEAGAADLMADLLTAADGRTVLLLTHRTEGLDRVDARYELRDGQLARCRRADTAAVGAR
ncbi:thiol reductant ABC exporter subunit CydC [Actinoplanes auranticolor]|uniref:ABC transporter n=1 Tax=Actinoplanes auranticolor TaxID=47988 RepID=A0A919VMM7_9ACTN|nr:thiol reductant ABC exporter subunit CydC [Actinoplanes auranticolor]GIM69098.1 ABC transporter [Actinoplanes auranticolor]